MLSVCLTDHVLNLPGCNPVVSQGGSVLLGLHLTDEETEAQGQRRIGPGRPMAGSRLGRAWTQHGHWRPDGQGASLASAAGPVCCPPADVSSEGSSPGADGAGYCGTVCAATP